jgi:glycosyltransferase involved in cell wall biosynthesis
MGSKNLLFVVTEDWYFCSHRLSLAVAAKQAGFSVSVATRITDKKYIPVIERAGITLLRLEKMTRGGKNPCTELLVIRELMRIYRSEKPDIIHHVAIKGVLYGSLAAKLTHMKATVNALAGLGHIFVSKQAAIRVLRFFILSVFRFSFHGVKTKFIFQNPDDQALFIDLKIADINDCYLVRGSGVNIEKFRPKNQRTEPPVFILASRMLWYKGIGELVEAARLLKAKGLAFRVILAGEPDLQNPKSIPEAQLKFWHEEGIIEWIGFCSDMVGLLSKCDSAVLPSYYGEGVPKFLIESAAMELPIITTQMPGCTEIARHEINGLLVPPKDIAALAEAMERIIRETALRQRLGNEGRKIVIREFEESIVNKATLNIYNQIL